MIIEKPSIYNTPKIYKDCGTIYNGNGVYNSGYGGGGGAGVVIGGRTYKVVDMPDGKTWLAENLDYKFTGLLVGGPIAPLPTVPAAWYYNNNEEMYGIDGEKKCGLMYNWYAIDYMNTNKEILFPGWHVPNQTEWENLRDSVGGSSIMGKKLKTANVDWAPSWGGVDEYGFNILPCGRQIGLFMNIGEVTYYCFSNAGGGSNVSAFGFNTGDASFSYSYGKSSAAMVRLVKD